MGRYDQKKFNGKIYTFFMRMTKPEAEKFKRENRNLYSIRIEKTDRGYIVWRRRK